VPASVGLDELYSQQGANLFSINCGSYTDVRLLRTGPDGQPLQPGPTVDPFQLALSARDRLPVPQGAIEANPTRSLVGLLTLFWYSGYDGRPLTRTTSAFGVEVEVEATPTDYRWTFGDGASLTSEGLGRALLHLARRCGWRVAKWSRFPSRRLPEVLKATNLGIADGVQGLWWRTPV